VVGVLVLGGVVVVLYQAISIPTPNSAFQAQTTFVYYRDGKQQLGTYYEDQNRESIPLGEMPQSIQDAVVAAENQSFWTDKGIDPKGILRALFSNARGNDRQGASTITQQYVKILYLTSEQSYKRKIKEAVVSLKIQQQLDKEEVLEGYLNTIYFGRGAYGIQAASKAYFNHPASELSLRESAVLATVLNNPAKFDPANGKEAKADLKVRYEYVLNSMAELGSITTEERDKALKRLPKFPEVAVQSQFGGQKGHMLTLVKKEILARGIASEDEIDGGGLRITTTFDPTVMTDIEESVVEQRPDAEHARSRHRRRPAPRRRRERRRRAPGRCGASSAARTTSSPRSTGRPRAASPGRRSRRSRSRRPSRRGSRSRTPSRATARSTSPAPSSRTRATRASGPRSR
jgi:membrane peptidoglycan carboxypeptidase